MIAPLLAFALTAVPAHSVRVLDASDSAPLSSSRAQVRSWYHATLLQNRGRWVDPRCCRVDDAVTMTADSRGVIALPDRRFIRNVVVVHIDAPGHLPGEILYHQGRLAALRIGGTEISGRALDRHLGRGGRGPGGIDLRLPRHEEPPKE